MDPEAIFLSGYALVLVAVAAGLESLGRRSADPWSSRVLAASRPPDTPRRPDVQADWPHSEVPAFHLGVSAVILAAALLLTIVSVARHHRPFELVVQLAVLVLISARIGRAAGLHRARHRTGPPDLERS